MTTPTAVTEAMVDAASAAHSVDRISNGAILRNIAGEDYARRLVRGILEAALAAPGPDEDSEAACACEGEVVGTHSATCCTGRPARPQSPAQPEGTAREAAEAERDELRADAERYRWLTARIGATRFEGVDKFYMPLIPAPENVMQGSVEQHFNAAIDKARGLLGSEGESRG